MWGPYDTPNGKISIGACPMGDMAMVQTGALAPIGLFSDPEALISWTIQALENARGQAARPESLAGRDETRTSADPEGFARYRRTQIAELRPYSVADDMTEVPISEADRDAGSPRPGDMIARNPANHADQWLVSAADFAANFEPVGGGQ